MSALTWARRPRRVAFIVRRLQLDSVAARAVSAIKALAPQLGLAFVGDFAPTSPETRPGSRHDFAALREAFGDFSASRPRCVRVWGGCAGARWRPRTLRLRRGPDEAGHRQHPDARVDRRSSPKLPPFWLAAIPGRNVATRVARAAAGLPLSASATRSSRFHAPRFGGALLRGQDGSRCDASSPTGSSASARTRWMIESDLAAADRSPEPMRSGRTGAVPSPPTTRARLAPRYRQRRMARSGRSCTHRPASRLRSCGRSSRPPWMSRPSFVRVDPPRAPLRPPARARISVSSAPVVSYAD